MNDNSLLQIDQELDALLEQIEHEIEEQGEASREAMDRLQVFAEAMNLKVNRFGRYLSVVETRAAYCRKEAERLVDRARHTKSRVERTRQMVLCYSLHTTSGRSSPMNSHCAGRRTRRTA